VSGITGIELGPDACVLVRTGRRGLRTTVAGARTIDRTEWVGDREGLTGVLRHARRAHDMPGRAHVVAWEKGGGQSELSVGELSDLNPILMAGFEIEAILSPAEALLDLVRARQLDTTASAVAAVSMNTRGAAIAIVSNGTLISSRTFEWPLGHAFRQSRLELLERYVLVSQLAPQLQHLIEFVRPVYGAHVSSVLVSGTLPNLRSISMLLIEALDIEVETLDSAELLEPNLSNLAETVPGLQLAAAAATEKGAGTFPAKVSAAFAVLALALVGAWSYPRISGVGPVVPVLSAQQAAVVAAVKIDDIPPPPVTELKIESTIGRSGERSVSSPPTLPTAPTAVTALPPRPVAAAPEPPLPPLPRLDGVMISPARTLAIIDGNVVGPGDRAGGRTVVRIDREGVVLREPSGREVYVAIRTRK